MKKLTLALVLLASLTQCSKHHEQTNAVSDAQLLQAYSTIGALHNQALEKVYSELNSAPAISPAFVKASVDDYLKQKLGYTGGHQVAYTVEKKFALRPHPDAYWSGIEASYSLHVAPAVKTFSNAVYAMIASDGHCNADAIDALAKSSLAAADSEPTKQAIAAMASVAKSSSAYWSANAGKWDHLAHAYLTATTGAAMELKIDPKSVVIADVLGAGVGAVRGAIIGATGGTVTLPGIGTIAGGAAVGLVSTIGGAISSSVSAGLGSWFESLFD